MQKRPAAKLRGRSCSICFIGMRFLLRGDQKERGKCTVKFSEMPYARPDAGRAAEQYRELAARAKNADLYHRNRIHESDHHYVVLSVTDI